MAQQKKQTTTPTKVPEFGKMPPQAIELEEVVLGALILEKDAIERIELAPEDFYKTQHQKIYTAILTLRNQYSPIDMFTVSEQLIKTNELESVGGQYAIMLLTTKVSSAASIEYHASIIKQKSIARKLINLAGEMQEMSYNQETDVADVLEFIEQSFTDISTGSTHTDASDMSASINETIEYMKRLQNEAENGRPAAIPTGLDELNKQLNGGWKAPDLIVLGGRPSMGKTQFAVSFAKAATQSEYPTLFVSIEMTKIQLIIRMITENEAIDFYKIKTGKLSPAEWLEVDKMVSSIGDLKLHIADDFKIRYLNNIKSLARKMARKGELKLMIVDYLGLIKTNAKFGTRDLEIGYITGELKNLCKELNIPIILLAQLNRAEKGAKVRKPQLNDLRESGNIEQDADIVIFPHRAHYYDSEAIDTDGNSWKNRGELVIGKHREGEINAIVRFKHDECFKKIWDDGNYLKELLTANVNKEYTEPKINYLELAEKEFGDNPPF